MFLIKDQFYEILSQNFKHLYSNINNQISKLLPTCRNCQNLIISVNILLKFVNKIYKYFILYCTFKGNASTATGGGSVEVLSQLPNSSDHRL